MKLFYEGPFINAETLVMMLGKHGIIGTHQPTDPTVPADDPEDLNRPTLVFVTEADFTRACELFYAERQDEL